MTHKLGSALCNLTQSRFVEEMESVFNSSGMILELHEIDSIKLDFDFEPVNTALTICVSMHSKSTSMSS